MTRSSKMEASTVKWTMRKQFRFISGQAHLTPTRSAWSQTATLVRWSLRTCLPASTKIWAVDFPMFLTRIRQILLIVFCFAPVVMMQQTLMTRILRTTFIFTATITRCLSAATIMRPTLPFSTCRADRYWARKAYTPCRCTFVLVFTWYAPSAAASRKASRSFSYTCRPANSGHGQLKRCPYKFSRCKICRPANSGLYTLTSKR